MTNKIVFVVDVSGSMKSHGRLVQAIRSTYLILNWGRDDMRAAVITFTDHAVRWAGKQERCRHGALVKCHRDCDKLGWTKIPSYLKEMVAYLTSLRGSGLTVPSSAVKEAIEDTETNLTIVFISDGDFGADPVVKAIKAAQKVRKARGQARVPIMVWGAGDKAKDKESLKKIAKVGGGGLWVHGKNRAGPF